MSEPNNLYFLGVGALNAPPFSADDVEAVLKAAIGPSAVTRTQDKHGIVIDYWFEGDAHIAQVSFASHHARPLVLLGLYQVLLERAPATRAMDLLAAISTRLNLAIGRTSRYNMDCLPAEDEWEGALNMVDWFQYFGPELARRWTSDYLRSGPFERAEMFPGGAVALVVAPRPFGRLPRRAPADYLGIALRPLYGRNPATGERIVIPWD